MKLVIRYISEIKKQLTKIKQKLEGEEIGWLSPASNVD
jgi:hypothetical protein